MGCGLEALRADRGGLDGCLLWRGGYGDIWWFVRLDDIVVELDH